MEIKNWEKYQSLQNGKHATWFKTYTAILDDFVGWSWTKIGVFLSLLALRSRLGQGLPEDHSKLTLMLGTRGKKAQDALRVIRELTSDGFLIPLNQQNTPEKSPLEKRREEKRREEREAENHSLLETVEDHETMSAKSRIEEICLKEFGSVPKSFATQELGKCVKLYGSDEVVEAFRSWAEVFQRSGEPLKLYEFIRALPDIIKAQTTLQPVSEVWSVLDFLQEVNGISGVEVVFNHSQQVLIGQLLKEYGLPDLVSAYREFYGRQDDAFKLNRAAKNFVETASQFVAAIRKARLEQEAHQRQLDKLIEDNKSKQEADLDALKKKQEEEDSMVELELREDD